MTIERCFCFFNLCLGYDDLNITDNSVVWCGSIMNYFFLFVLIIGPALCILYCLLGIWENKRADDSIKRFEEQKRERL
jgi:hypothetical protein